MTAPCKAPASPGEPGATTRPPAGSGLSELRRFTLGAERLVEGFDPEALLPSETLGALTCTSRLVKMFTTLQALVAAQVKRSEAWRQSQDPSAAHRLAKSAGTSVKRAQELLETAAALGDLGATEAAARRGELSLEQAHLVAKAASANPDAEAKLLCSAQRASLGELKEETQRVTAAADKDSEATRRRLYAQRSLRTYTDIDGAFNLHLRHTPEAGARVMGTLQPLVDRHFHAARKEGRREPPQAYGADALVEAICGSTKGTGKHSGSTSCPKFIVRIDHQALVRGHKEGDEVCEISGIGPVAVSAITELGLREDPFWSAIVTKGKDVMSVAHLGRSPSAHQRTALEWLYPGCAARGCPRQSRLEFDHREEWAKTRHTFLPELDVLCAFHHAIKTNEGWALVEGTGKRDFVAPSDPRHPRYRPPARGPDDKSKGASYPRAYRPPARGPDTKRGGG